MGRTRPGEAPFNQRTDGPPAYRQPDEPEDGRPVLVGSPFWQDASERLMYEDAVQQNPKREDEGALAYAERVSGVVTGEYTRVQLAMPRTRMSQREWQRRQNAVKWDANNWRGM